MEILLTFFGFLTGLCLGSFASVIIERLIHDQGGIIWGRSQCPHCHKILTWWQLIPVLSWLLQKGRCHNCEQKISSKYPLLELATAIVFVLHFTTLSSWTDGLLVGALLFLVLVLGFYDAWYHLVDQRIVWPAIGLMVLYVLGFESAEWQWHALGGGLGYLFYAFQYYASRGRWVGMGDMWLGILLGGLLGLSQLLFAIMFAYLSALVYVGIWKCFKPSLDLRGLRIPIGAFLMFSLLVFWFWGPALSQAYWNFLLL